MQTAEQILTAIRKLGERRLPLTRVYRCLYNENLFLVAYGKLARNQGGLTPGTTNDTIDGMSVNRIRTLIAQLREERYRVRPARRIHIPKKQGGTRPLGIPNFTEKLVQEVLRMILNAYYEPRFRESSHGFRPNRGCHTALRFIKHRFIATTWFIEGDIRKAFDSINHTVLLNILARDIHDGRLLNLLRMHLEAGVMENWTITPPTAGHPRGACSVRYSAISTSTPWTSMWKTSLSHSTPVALLGLITQPTNHSPNASSKLENEVIKPPSASSRNNDAPVHPERKTTLRSVGSATVAMLTTFFSALWVQKRKPKPSRRTFETSCVRNSTWNSILTKP